MHREDGRRAADQRDMREIPYGIERHFSESRRDHVRSNAGNNERVTVGRTLRSDVRADDTAGAGAVLHDEALAQTFTELCREYASKRIRRTTGRERRDHAYRFR